MLIERRLQLNLGTNRTYERRRSSDNVTKSVPITYEREPSAILTVWEWAHSLKVVKTWKSLIMWLEAPQSTIQAPLLEVVVNVWDVESWWHTILIFASVEGGFGCYINCWRGSECGLRSSWLWSFENGLTLWQMVDRGLLWIWERFLRFKWLRLRSHWIRKLIFLRWGFWRKRWLGFLFYEIMQQR